MKKVLFLAFMAFVMSWVLLPASSLAFSFQDVEYFDPSGHTYIEITTEGQEFEITLNILGPDDVIQTIDTAGTVVHVGAIPEGTEITITINGEEPGITVGSDDVDGNGNVSVTNLTPLQIHPGSPGSPPYYTLGLKKTAGTGYVGAQRMTTKGTLTPEPSTMIMFGLGSLGMAIKRKKFKFFKK